MRMKFSIHTRVKPGLERVPSGMPDTRKPLYLDAMASTPLDPRVAAAMAPFWSETFGNPHSNDHQFGWRANAAVGEAVAGA
jgi:selenocysteine lyase/cysteine desulfurase